jgi:hypothetical protein
VTAATVAQDLLEDLLDRHCTACGEALPQPGQPCACGAVPRVTRAEAEERLAKPGAVAVIRAARIRMDVRKRQQQDAAALREADMIEHVSRLEMARDEAAAKLPGPKAEAARLARGLDKARARERDAAAQEDDARANHKRTADAYEAARRTRADAAARTAALTLANTSATVLQADESAHQAAISVREQAEAVLAAARVRVSGLEEAAAAAERALTSPGRPPKSVVTLTMDLLGQIRSGDLTEAEQAWIRHLGGAVAGFSGAGDDIAGRAVELAERERRDSESKRALFLQPLGGGNFGAVANPGTGGVPAR